MGLGLQLLALHWHLGPTMNILVAILYGFVAAKLHTAVFEIDPLGNKRIDGIKIFQQDRVAKMVDKIEFFYHQ